MLIAHASTNACSYKTVLSVNPAMNKTHPGIAQHRAMAGTGTDFGSGDGQLPFCPSFLFSLLLAASTYSIIKPATFQANFQPYSPHTSTPTTTVHTPYRHKERSPEAKCKGRKLRGCPCALLPPGGAEQCWPCSAASREKEWCLGSFLPVLCSPSICKCVEIMGAAAWEEQGV